MKAFFLTQRTIIRRSVAVPFSFAGVFRGAFSVSLVLGLSACQSDDPTPPDKRVYWNTGGEVPVTTTADIRYGQIPAITQLGFLDQTNTAGVALDRSSQKVYAFDQATVPGIYQLDPELKHPVKTGQWPGDVGGNGANADYGLIGDMLFANGMIYWSQGQGTVGTRIGRIKPDGSQWEALYRETDATPDTLGLNGLAISENGTDLYWATDSLVWRGSANGEKNTIRVVLDLTKLTPKRKLNDLTVWKGKLYLATTHGIWMGDADGSGTFNRLFEAETQPAQHISGIEVDARHEQLYWFSQILPRSSDTSIDYQFLYRGNLDGSGSKKLLERFPGPGIQLQVY